MLVAACVLSFDTLAYRERTAPVRRPERASVAREVSNGSPAKVRLSWADDKGDVHVDASNKTRRALYLNCELRALGRDLTPATIEDPAWSGRFLLRPEQAQEIELQLDTSSPSRPSSRSAYPIGYPRGIGPSSMPKTSPMRCDDALG